MKCPTRGLRQPLSAGPAPAMGLVLLAHAVAYGQKTAIPDAKIIETFEYLEL
ncbi:hypothetical protein GCM10022254_33670 [Actinomadura meridiana]|uniref:Uncharacterized protein n=1 Tax=Actinomadura meridiana TaxID=559626 RepID=A0ABP8C3L6_9ACTN